MRTRTEVQQEYFQACADAGNIKYQITIHEAALAEVIEKMKALNIESETLPVEPDLTTKETENGLN